MQKTLKKYIQKWKFRNYYNPPVENIDYNNVKKTNFKGKASC